MKFVILVLGLGALAGCNPMDAEVPYAECVAERIKAGISERLDAARHDNMCMLAKGFRAETCVRSGYSETCYKRDLTVGWGFGG